MSQILPPPPGFRLDPPSGASKMPAPPDGFVMDGAPSASQGQGPTTGLLENIGAGIDQGANAVLGSVVDLPVWAGNQIVNAANGGLSLAGQGSPIPNIPVDLPGSSQNWERTQARFGFTPPSAVVPADEGQRLARAASEATTMALLPETAMIKVGQIASKLPAALQAGSETFAALLGQSRTGGQLSRNIMTNAAAGAGSQGAMDAAPDGWKPLAGLAGGLSAATVAHEVTSIPGMVKSGVKLAGDYLTPITQGGRERVAGQTLRDAATDPGAVIDALDSAPQELVHGSRPTTFQATGDMGLGSLERGVAARNPAEFMQRRADQNAARITAMEGIQPGGAPEKVVTALRGFMDDIEKQSNEVLAAAAKSSDDRVLAANQSSDRSISAALARATDRVEGIGAGAPTEVAGARMREALEAARASAKEQERALWRAVDPDGNLSLSASSSTEGAARIRKEMPASAKPMSGEEAAIFDVMGRYGRVVPFSELTAVQSRLKTEMRAERIASGESVAYRRMSQLNAAIQQDLETAIAGKVAKETEAVQGGAMRYEDTAEYRLAQERERWTAARREGTTRLDGTTGLSTYGGSRQAPVSGAYGAEGEISSGPRNSSSDPRLSPDDIAPNFDQEALGRLNAARGATKERAETFDNSTLGPIRRRPSTVSPYDTPASSVPGRVFFPGPKSVEAIEQYRRAVGDAQALPALRDYAVDRLRKTAMRPDGTIDPAKATSWARQHADALRAFPDLDRAIHQAATASADIGTVTNAQRGLVRDAETEARQKLAEVAKAEKQRVDDAQVGVVGRLLGVSDPQEVVRTVGAVFGRQDSVTQMGRIRGAIGDNAEAAEGLRKAVAEYAARRFVGNTEAGTSGLGTMKSDQFQTFVQNNRAALKVAGFADDEIGLMEAIAKDLQQSNRSLAAVKLPGGSNTAQDVIAAKAGDSTQTILTKLVAASAVSGGGASIFGGPLIGIPVGIATAVVGAMRQSGLTTIDDLVKDAMLNPERARLLLSKATPESVQAIGATFPQAIGRAAIISQTVGRQEQDGKPGNLVRAALMARQKQRPPSANSAVASALLSRQGNGQRAAGDR